MISEDAVVEQAIGYASIFSKWIHHILKLFDVSDQNIPLARFILLSILLLITLVVLVILTNKVVRFLITRAEKVSQSLVLGYMVSNKLPFYLGLIVPYIITKNILEVLFIDYPHWVSPLDKFLELYLVLVIINTLRAMALSFVDLLQNRPAFKNKPLQSYSQVITIVLYVIGSIVCFAILTGKSAGTILTTLGALSAVTMLVFQDAIKGFVGSIQMSVNNMVELGDWIEMPKYRANGRVKEVTLTTVKVQNFDMTIVTIPTYALVSDSFQNWKGVSKAGARRVVKSIYIKQRSIRFMKEEELDRFRKIDYLNEAILAKEQHNLFVDRELLGDVVPVTNCDLYVAYLQNYLTKSKLVQQGDSKRFTQLVRIMEPSSEGVPIQLYFFTSTTNWVEYEAIATELMAHFMSVVHIFDLRLYEAESDGEPFAENRV